MGTPISSVNSALDLSISISAIWFLVLLISEVFEIIEMISPDSFLLMVQRFE